MEWLSQPGQLVIQNRGTADCNWGQECYENEGPQLNQVLQQTANLKKQLSGTEALNREGPTSTDKQQKHACCAHCPHAGRPTKPTWQPLTRGVRLVGACFQPVVKPSPEQ